VWGALKDAGADGGISWWDASGTFFEARQVKRKEFVRRRGRWSSSTPSISSSA